MRLIDIDKVLSELCLSHKDIIYIDKNETAERIRKIPSIDIVRCKKCKWGKPYSDKQLECDALGLGGLKFPDEFCSHGERREP